MNSIFLTRYFSLLVAVVLYLCSTATLSQALSTYQWSALSNNNNIPARTDAAVQSNGRQIVLLTGGRWNGVPNNDVYATNDGKTWIAQSRSSTSTSYFTARHSHSIGYCQDTALPSSTSAYWIYGGQNAQNANLNDLWKSIAPVTNIDQATSTTASKWTQVKNSAGTGPGNRCGARMLCFAGKLYLLGCLCSGATAKNLYVYTISSNSWTSSVDNAISSSGVSGFAMFLSSDSATATANSNTRLLYVFGNDNQYQTHVSSVLSASTSAAAPILSTIASSTNNPHLSNALYLSTNRNNIVYLLGGIPEGSSSSSVSMYIANITNASYNSPQWLPVSTNATAFLNSAGSQVISSQMAAFYWSNTANVVYVVDFRNAKTYSATIPSCANSNPCLNGGRCIDDNPLNDLRCDCSSSLSYQGATCSELDLCHRPETNCSNYGLDGLVHGQCIVTSLTTRQCQCYTPWYGDNCQNANQCLINPNRCSSHGQCLLLSDGTTQCQCSAGYFGDSCEKRNVCLLEQPCANGADCTSIGDGTYQCVCPEAFYGVNCTLPNPCVVYNYPLWLESACGDSHIARCTNLETANGDFNCTCTDLAYSGDRCQTFDPCYRGQAVCDANYFNNATCVLSAISGGYECQCKPNWGGYYCDVYNPCLLDPTLCGADSHRGRCLFQPKNAAAPYYGCACNRPPTTQDFFYNPSTQCQYRARCRSALGNPCLNGGVCTDTAFADNQYSCACPSGFNGTNCEFVV
jgi:hypothetical protein